MTNEECEPKTVLVVGATGATGQHVVQQLLRMGHTVRAVVRSEERMKSLLSPETTPIPMDKLELTEASLLDLSSPKLTELTKGCDAIVSCLGHNLNFQGIWGKPYQLVTQAVQRLCQAATTNQEDEDEKKKKRKESVRFILMGSNGVAHPNGQEPKRSFGERLLLSILRICIPPHADNEDAAAYLYHYHKPPTTKTTTTTETGEVTTLVPPVAWSVVRPDDLIDLDTVTPYDLTTQPEGSLFGGGTASRINVANAMVNLITNDTMWNEWKYKMPVLRNSEQETTKSEK